MRLRPQEEFHYIKIIAQRTKKAECKKLKRRQEFVTLVTTRLPLANTYCSLLSVQSAHKQNTIT
jgi:hypothetical protein